MTPAEAMTPPVARKGRLVTLLAAGGVSLIGTRMTFVALPWLVLVTTGSATRTGIVAFAEMLPYVLVSAACGPLVDRLGPRRAAIGFNLLSALAVSAVPVLYQVGALRFATLVALVAGAGALRGMGDSAARVLLPLVAEASGTDITRTVAVQDGLARAATLLGAPLGGVLVATFGAPNVLLLDAASFAVAAVLVAGGRGRGEPQPTSSTVEASEAPTRYLSQLREGVAFVRRDRLVLGITGMLFVTNLVDQAQGTVLVPVWAREDLGSAVGIGLISGAFALGAVAGNLCYTPLAPRLPRYLPFAVGFLVGGCPRLVMLAIDAPLWSVLAVSVAGGVALSVVNPILGAVSYERVPAHLRARVLGLLVAVSWAGIPLGSLLGGWLVDRLGLRPALLLGAGLYLVATLAPFLGRHWREMDSRPATPAVEPARA
jgi:MFS family permease